MKQFQGRAVKAYSHVQGLSVTWWLAHCIVRDLNGQTFRERMEKHPGIPLVWRTKEKGRKQVSRTLLAMFSNKHDSCHAVLWELCPCRGMFYMLWVHLQDSIPRGNLMQEMQYCWFSWRLTVRQQSVSAGHLIPEAQIFLSYFLYISCKKKKRVGVCAASQVKAWNTSLSLLSISIQIQKKSALIS